MPKWEPKSKVEQTTIAKYRGKPRQWRMDEAVRLVIEDGLSQSEAARMCGVSRPKVNVNVQEKRKMLAEQADRSKRSLEERAGIISATIVPDASDVPVEPEQKPTQEYITEGRRVPSFREFNELYFGHEQCPDCGKHHETPAFHGQIMDLLEDRSKRMKLVNLAPYHGKSTIATFKSTLFELVRDPNSRTAVISAGSDLAGAFLDQIRFHLADSSLYDGAARNLIEDWGPFYNPNSWSADEIRIYGRSNAQKDPSISVYGWGSKIYGRRFDRMIFDDVADTDNQNTPAAIEKMWRKMWKEYTTRVGKTGQLIWVGTRIANGDIYSMLDDVAGMSVLRFPCILDEDTQQTLWPDHFPYEDAIKYRSAMSLEDFQLVYQNVDTLGVNASFTPEMLEAARDRDRFIGTYDSSWGLVAGLDPAGANDQAGYTAMVLMGLDPATGKRHIVDLVNIKQMKAPDILSQVYDWAERYPLRELRVETNGLQMVPTDTPVLTDVGWSSVGELSVGDRIAAPDGSWTAVEAVSDKSVEQMFEMTLSDGSKLESHAGHRWFVQPVTKGARAQPERFMTTAEILDQWDDYKRFRIRAPEPLEGVEADLPLDPYVFGAWLGDGTRGMAQFTQDDSNEDQGELRAAIELAGYETRTQSGRNRFGALGMLPALRATGAFHDKHVPDIYLQASFKQRLSLLQGLMDTDGTIAGEWGHAVFYNTNPRLIEAVEYLLLSLGFRPCPARWHSHNRDVPIGVVKFYPNSDLPNPFRLTRKAEKVQSRTKDRSKWLTIRSLEPTRETLGACIRVAHPSSQFLCGKRLIPTGNSQIFQYSTELNQRLVNRGIRLVPHITHGRNKWDPQFGVESMAALFHNGLISLPYGDINSRAKVRELEDQLLGFPMARTSDLVMAMWFASLGCREFATRTALPAFDPRMKVPGRISRNRRVMNFADREVRQPSRFDLTGELEPNTRDLVKLANMDSSVMLRG